MDHKHAVVGLASCIVLSAVSPVQDIKGSLEEMQSIKAWSSLSFGEKRITYWGYFGAQFAIPKASFCKLISRYFWWSPVWCLHGPSNLRDEIATTSLTSSRKWRCLKSTDGT